jgi:ribonucleoside-diphosphate reductase alpha chain
MGASTKSITKDQVSAIDHLEVWKKFSLNWCEHKPSVTIYVTENEWLAVGAWCWENFDILSGVSFLPKADDAHIYEAAAHEGDADILDWQFTFIFDTLDRATRAGVLQVNPLKAKFPPDDPIMM